MTKKEALAWIIDINGGKASPFTTSFVDCIYEIYENGGVILSKEETEKINAVLALWPLDLSHKIILPKHSGMNPMEEGK